MAWRYLFAAILAACPLGAAQAVEFPYVAYVNSADVYVRSGPGRDYYPTDKLQKGEKVEVYRHDPGGWLAIRPPRQSFSWVSTRHLDPTEDRLAMVNSSRVVARVGSTFSDVRDVIQVRLEKGEQVALVDSPASDSPWCKIAPPAGEFRWVFSKFVDSELPEDVARDEREAAGESDLADEASDRARRSAAGQWSAEGGSRAARRHPSSTARGHHQRKRAPARVGPHRSGTVGDGGGRDFDLVVRLAIRAGQYVARSRRKRPPNGDERGNWSTNWPASRTSRSGTTRFAIRKRRPWPVPAEAGLPLRRERSWTRDSTAWGDWPRSFPNGLGGRSSR